MAEGVEKLVQPIPFDIGDVVHDLGRYLIEHRAGDDAILFQLTQLLGEHLLAEDATV